LPNNPRKQYRVIREIPNTGVAQLIVSRLGAEGIDVRLRNANSSSIYPLIGIGLRIEVDIEQFEQAETLIGDI